MYKSNYAARKESPVHLCRDDVDREQDDEELVGERFYYDDIPYFTCEEDIANKLKELMAENIRLRQEKICREEKIRSLSKVKSEYESAYIELQKQYDALKRQTREVRDEHPEQARPEVETQPARQTPETSGGKSIPVAALLDRTQEYIVDDDSPKDKVDFVKALYHKVFEDFENTKITKLINKLRRKPAQSPAPTTFLAGAIKVESGANAVIAGQQTWNKGGE